MEAQHLADFIADDVVAARAIVRASVALDLNLHATVFIKDFSDPVGKLQDAVVFVNDVKDFAARFFRGCPEKMDIGVNGVTDMQERPPDFAVTVDR